MRPIDGDELKKRLNNGLLDSTDALVESVYECNSMIEWAIEVVDAMPTVEKQAKWVVKSELVGGSRKYYICCSVCGQEYEKNANYCSNCGSRMVEDE